MITEDEARKCWCPFAAVSNQYGSSGHNRPLKVRDAWPTEIAAEFLDATKCIASECMAWRWGRQPGSIKSITIDAPLYGHGGPSKATAEVEPAGQRRGYCGLAGAA